MNKFYTTVIAAACAVFSMNATEQVSLTKSDMKVLPDFQATAVAPRSFVKAEASAPSRANYCTGAMYHYNSVLYQMDQFEMPVEKTVENGKDVYVVKNMFRSKTVPNGFDVRIEVDENNIVTIPVQEAFYIPDFLTYGPTAPDGVRGNGYIADIYTAYNAFDPRLGFNTSNPESWRTVSKYDPETGTARMRVMYLFWADGLKLNNGAQIDTYYPIEFTVGYPDDGYDILRSEILQLGDWANDKVVKYTDSYLPGFGFDVETYDVTIQNNVQFPKASRIMMPFSGNTQLYPEDFIRYTDTNEPIASAMLIYSVDDAHNFLGKTYSGLNIAGTESPEFGLSSFITYLFVNGATWADAEKERPTDSNGNFVFEGTGFGQIKEGHLTFGANKNYYDKIGVCEDNSMPWVYSENWYVMNDLYDLEYPYTGGGEGGVEDIIADGANVNAPVEYFNVQGVRVENPRQGGMYIRRQGTEVSKVIL